MKFVIDDKIPFIKGAFEPFGEVKYLPGKNITSKDVVNADALITRTRTRCDAHLLKGSSVKIIASATIGYDHIDTEWCERNGIMWTNAPGCNSSSVMQYVASVFSLLVTEKKINPEDMKIGIVGVGNVGSKVSVAAKIFGMEVFEIDPPRQEAEPDKKFHVLDDIAGELDIITFHTPLTRSGLYKTYHLFDEELLKKLKKGVILINSSRGEVVDNKLLKEALKRGDVRFAVLDVWENEPAIDHDLLDLVWIATPHIAGYSQDGKANGTMMSVQAVSREIGLGIDDWVPSGVPEPEDPHIVIDQKKLTDPEILSHAILHTYNVRNDDLRLRNEPEQFEYLRGVYPPRREFFKYDITLKNGGEETKEKLKALGFNVKDRII